MGDRKKIGIFTADLMTPGGSSRKGCLMAERLSRRHEVWLISKDRVDTAALSRSFGVSLEEVRFLCLDDTRDPPQSPWSGLKRLVPSRVRNILEQIPAYRRLRRLQLDLFILNTSFHYVKSPAPRAIFMCMFPWPMPAFPRAGWCRLPIVKTLIDWALANTLNRYPHVAETYDVITANSEFTASWIKRRWNRDARVVYSATELMPPPPAGSKDRIILVAGRYNWDKQQHALIEAFRGMSELHDAGWELHLVGKVHPASRPYYAQLLKGSHGYPVVFHHDLSLEELRNLYARSAIYWHAKGFDVPEDEPQRMEHFGNTPIEAMSAGCVPVVMDAGGLRETVQHGFNGFRWRTLPELQARTLDLVRNPALLAEMRTRAAQIDPRFGVKPFLEAVAQVVEEVFALDQPGLQSEARGDNQDVRRYHPPAPSSARGENC